MEHFILWVCIISLTVGAIYLVGYVVREMPGVAFGVLAVAALAASCSKSDAAEPLRFEVSIVLDDAADKPAADEAMAHAAGIFRSQLGIELATVYSEVGYVADHTKPEALLIALQTFRDNRPNHRASDATVLLTRRELTRMTQGIANVGPACSSAAAAVVSLKADGLDGQIVAHELLHTIGVPHDHAPGWLMSESLTRNGIETLSPDTISTVKAAPLDCMLAIEPRTASQSNGVEPPSTASQGGGGAFDPVFILMLLALVAVALTGEVRVKRAKLGAHCAEHEAKSLRAHAPPDFCLRDICGLSQSHHTRAGNRVEVEFTTMAGALDFSNWLVEQCRRARREANNTRRTEAGTRPTDSARP